jgi:hypothetical protein
VDVKDRLVLGGLVAETACWVLGNVLDDNVWFGNQEENKQILWAIFTWHYNYSQRRVYCYPTTCNNNYLILEKNQ